MCWLLAKIFRQVVRVHDSTISSFLEEAVTSAIDRTSSLQAREEVRVRAALLNSVVDEAEKRCASSCGVCVCVCVCVCDGVCVCVCVCVCV
jgi:hypothetical protein